MNNQLYKNKIILLKQDGNKDTPIQSLSQIFKQIKINKPSIIQHIWLSSQSFTQILMGSKLPDSNGNLTITKSTFLRKYQKITQSNPIGLMIFENAQILNQDQKQLFSLFLKDLKDDFLKINNQKIKMKENIRIIIRIHNRQIFNTWKFSKQIPIFQSTTNQQIIKEMKMSSQYSHLINNQQNQDQVLQGIRIYKQQDKFILNLGKHGNNKKIILSAEIISNYKDKIDESNILFKKYKESLQLKNNINFIHKNLWNVLIFSTNCQIKKDNLIQYQKECTTNFMKFYAENFIGSNSFQMLNKQQILKLKQLIEIIIKQNNLSNQIVNDLKNKRVRQYRSNLTIQNKLTIGFGALVDKQGIQTQLQKAQKRCNQTYLQMKFANVSKISQIQKIFYDKEQKFIGTPQSLKILGKCQQVVDKNQIFLVLQGPTGVGKTHVPKIYSFLTQAKLQNGKLMIPNNKYANIAFHQDKDQLQFQGKYVVKKDGKVQFDSQTIFKKIVQASGVILLSELNTVINNRQATLAWWLKQIQNTKPNQNGDRIIQLQSIYTHNNQLYKVCIKKGTLIVVDINSKDYIGRTNLPDHFAPKNRLIIKPLITQTDNQFSIKKQLKVLAKYIELFWNQKIQNQNQQQYNKKNKKYLQYAKIMRRVVVAYQKQQFGNLSSQEKQQGKNRKWIFSVRQIERIIKDIAYIEKHNYNKKQQEILQVLYQQFALKWKDKQDRNKIKNILIESELFSIKSFTFNVNDFFQRNLQNSKRPVFWMMDQYQNTATQQVLILNLDIKKQNIQSFKMSYQFGQWELFGGQVPSIQNPQIIEFKQGILLNWLIRNQNSEQKQLIILQNINTMQIGAVSMLNNFLQNLENSKLYHNKKQYTFPKNGMIILISRQQINWSPAQSSRLIYFRVEQQINQISRIKLNIQDFFLKKQFQNLKQRLKTLKNITIQKLHNLVLTSAHKYFNDSQKIRFLVDQNNSNKILQRTNKQHIQIIKKLQQTYEKIKNLDGQFLQLGKKIQKQLLNEQNKKMQQLEFKLEKFKTDLKSVENQRQSLQLMRNQITQETESQKLKQKLKQLKAKEKKIRNQVQQLDQVLIQMQQIQIKNKKQLKNAENKKIQINKEIEDLHNSVQIFQNSFESIVERIYFQELNLLKEVKYHTQNNFKYILKDNKVYFMYNQYCYATKFQIIPQNVQKFKNQMRMTPQLARILQSILHSFSKNRNVYLEGNPGVGKTKITEFVAQILNKKIYIYQMSANVELSDMIGGLQPKFKQNKQIIQINREKNLLKFIKQGGIYVLDEAALSIQAKQVISWFSQLVQRKPDEEIYLSNVPGDNRKYKIHKDFHLVITGNNPKKVLSRKQLPKEVLYYIQTIKYQQKSTQQDIIKIAEIMIYTITGKKNDQLAKSLGKFHFQINKSKYQNNIRMNQSIKLKSLKMTNRDMQKVVHLLNNGRIDQITKQSLQYKRAIYQVYFSRLQQIEKNAKKIKNQNNKYFEIGQQIIFSDHLQMMSSHRQPLLIIYQQRKKSSLIKTIKAKFPKIQIFKAMSCYTQQNLIGGYAPTQNGEMIFKLSGIGCYLIQNKQEIQTKQPKQVLICDIHLIKQGVRTQLNQLLQDGWTYINDKQYYWPKKLKLLFTVSNSKIHNLSEPYLSRHQQIRFSTNHLVQEKFYEKIQAKQIQNKIKNDKNFKIINFFGKQKQKDEALNNFRRKQQNYTRLFVSKQLEQIDWMVSIQKQGQKFEINLQGLYKQLNKNNQVIQIIGLDYNPMMLNVIQSIIMNQWIQNKTLNAMIPGFKKFDIKNVAIILNTNVQINKLLADFIQWPEVNYYLVLKNRIERTNEQNRNIFKQKENQSNNKIKPQEQIQQKNNQTWLDNSHQQLKKIQNIISAQKQKIKMQQNLKKQKQKQEKIKRQLQLKNEQIFDILKAKSTIHAPPKVQVNVQNKNKKKQKPQIQKSKQKNVQINNQKIPQSERMTQVSQSQNINDKIPNSDGFKKQKNINNLKKEESDKKQQNFGVLMINLQINQNQQQQQSEQSSHQQLQIQPMEVFSAMFSQQKNRNYSNYYNYDVSILAIWQKQLFFIMQSNQQLTLNQIVFDLSLSKFTTLASSKLKKVNLNMRLAQFDFFNFFIQGIKKLKNLEQLILDFFGLQQISDDSIKSLLDSLKDIKSLKNLQLNLSECRKITNKTIEYIKIYLKKSKNKLQSLSLIFCQNTNITQQMLNSLKNQNLNIKADSFYGFQILNFPSQQKINKIAKQKCSGLIIQFSSDNTQRQIFKIIRKLKDVEGLNTLFLNFTSNECKFQVDHLKITLDFFKQELKYLKKVVFTLNYNTQSQEFIKMMHILSKQQHKQNRNRNIFFQMFNIQNSKNKQQRMQLE